MALKKNAGEDVEKREPSYTIGGNVNWYNHCGKQYGNTSENLNTELPYDPAILSWAYIQTEISLKKIHAPLCSSQHCSQ